MQQIVFLKCIRVYHFNGKKELCLSKIFTKYSQFTQTKMLSSKYSQNDKFIKKPSLVKLYKY